MKKIIITLIMCTILFNGMNLKTEAFDMPLRVVLDNNTLSFPDIQPFIDDSSRTQIPARFIGESLGAEVSWDAEKQQAIFEKDNTKLTINIGSDEYELNGRNLKMDTEAMIEEGRTFVPVRYVAEAFGATVGWNADSWTVIIESDKSTTLETGISEEGVYDEIAFDPLKDIDISGHITDEKAAEFCMKMAKTIRFYKKGEELWIKGEYPELPEGIEWDVFLNVEHKVITNVEFYKTRYVPEGYPGITIVDKGLFDIKAEGQDLESVDYLAVYVQIRKMDKGIVQSLNIKTDKTSGEKLNRAFFKTFHGDNIRYDDVFDYDTLNQWY